MIKIGKKKKLILNQQHQIHFTVLFNHLEELCVLRNNVESIVKFIFFQMTIN